MGTRLTKRIRGRPLRHSFVSQPPQASGFQVLLRNLAVEPPRALQPVQQRAQLPLQLATGNKVSVAGVCSGAVSAWGAGMSAQSMALEHASELSRTWGRTTGTASCLLLSAWTDESKS